MVQYFYDHMKVAEDVLQKFDESILRRDFILKAYNVGYFFQAVIRNSKPDAQSLSALSWSTDPLSAPG